MQDIKVTVIWITLISLTLTMYIIAKDGFEKQHLAILILAASWFKGQMIIDHFMGLRRVRVLWRLIISAWLLLVLSVVFSVYLWG